MASPDDLERLRALVGLYTKTKRWILLAEETDPESRSNIAVFKEQRDALDHIMRALGPAPEAAPGNYVELQIGKAKGHLYRAAYDAIDGLAVNAKVHLSSDLDGMPNEAIEKCAPEYFSKWVPRLTILDKKLAEHRNRKDVGDVNTEANLESYAALAMEVFEIRASLSARIPAMVEWKQRARGPFVRDKFVIPLVILIVGLILGLFVRQCTGH